MVVQFRAANLDKFETVFDSHVITIERLDKVSPWRVYVDGKLTSIPLSYSSKEQQTRVEGICQRHVIKRAQSAPPPKPYKRVVKPAIPDFLTSAGKGARRIISGIRDAGTDSR